MATTLAALLALVPTNNIRSITAVSLQTLLTDLLHSASAGALQNDGADNLSWVPSGGGGGAVDSVTDDGSGTLTIAPTTGAVLAGINLAAANTWIGIQTVPQLSTTDGVTSDGTGQVTISSSAPAGQLLTLQQNAGGNPSYIAMTTQDGTTVYLNNQSSGVLQIACSNGGSLGVINFGDSIGGNNVQLQIGVHVFLTNEGNLHSNNGFSGTQTPVTSITCVDGIVTDVS